MLYWYTGQPGHGKTLHAIEHAMEMKREADAKHRKDPSKYPFRPLLICNVRDAKYDLIGGEELTPDDFKAWADTAEYIQHRDAIEADFTARKIDKDHRAHLLEQLGKQKFATEEINPRFVNAILLIDEAYEHGMLPKRPNSAALPRHVERMAKHRHYGMDIIAVCQSPDSQCDVFVRDLIERHIHVRRKFGTQYVHLRVFDRYEANAEKAHATTVKRVRLPKGPRGMYKSTELDTTSGSIPWYYWVLGGCLIAIPAWGWHTWGRISDRLSDAETELPTLNAARPASQTDGAPATAVASVGRRAATLEEHLSMWRPLIASQPWTAPAYADVLTLPHEPPRLFCVIGGAGLDGQGDSKEAGCRCHTEQGTRYRIDRMSCELIAINGQYEPYRRPSLDNIAGMPLDQQPQRWSQDAQRQRRAAGNSAAESWGMASYGDMGIQTGRYVGQGVGR